MLFSFYYGGLIICFGFLGEKWEAGGEGEGGGVEKDRWGAGGRRGRSRSSRCMCGLGLFLAYMSISYWFEVFRW